MTNLDTNKEKLSTGVDSFSTADDYTTWRELAHHLRHQQIAELDHCEKHWAQRPPRHNDAEQLTIRALDYAQANEYDKQLDHIPVPPRVTAVDNWECGCTTEADHYCTQRERMLTWATFGDTNGRIHTEVWGIQSEDGSYTREIGVSTFDTVTPAEARQLSEYLLAAAAVMDTEL